MQDTLRVNTPSLVVLSRAGVERVNRTPYRLLHAKYGVHVHMIIPDELRLGNAVIRPEIDESMPVSALPLANPHEPRLEFFRGASKVIAACKPTHVLVENDPASFMTVSTTRSARGVGAELWSLTCENLERDYSREAVDALGRLKPRAFAAGLLNATFHRISLSKVSRVFTISGDGTRAMARLGFSDRTTQIPLGFDATLFRPQGKEQIDEHRRQLGLIAPTIGYFGRIVPEKGLDVLIHALSKRMDRDWQLLLDEFSQYKTPYLETITALLRKTGVERRTVFFRSKHADIANYMNACDLVILPSLSFPKWKEQYGRVIPEAMACGKVVIGSSSGALPELIADCGFTFPEGDVTGLSERISQALSMSATQLSELGARASQRAHAHLSADREAEILYRCLLRS